MKTDIEYLKTLELDLEHVAALDEVRHTKGRGGGRRRRKWPAWTAAAAALLVVAFAIGSYFNEGAGIRGLPAALHYAGSDESGGTAGEPTRDAQVPEAREKLLLGPTYNSEAYAVAASDTDDSSATSPPAASASPAPGQADPIGQDLSKIVRDGQISLELPDGDFGETFAKVVNIAEQSGGMVLSSSTQGDGAGGLTLRIPASEFDRAFLAISELGRPLSSSTKGQDVTAQFIDLNAHLKILKTKRDFYFNLFENATTVSQSIQLEGRLEDVQLEIDKIQGQLRFINDQVALSTLKVSLREKNAPKAEDPEDILKPSLGLAWERSVQGTLRVLATVLVGLGYLLPIAIIAGIVLGVVMLVRRRDRGAS